MLLILLSVMGALQLVTVSNVFADAGAEFTAAVEAAYTIFGLVLAYLLITNVADWCAYLISLALEGSKPPVPVEYLYSGLWAAGAVGMVLVTADSWVAISGQPDLTQAVRIIAVSFVLVLALRAVPQSAWAALRRRVPSVGGESA